jgi:hypothetical protein
MPPPFFDPEFLRLAAASAASTNPLFRFPDFNSVAAAAAAAGGNQNPYFNSLSNFFQQKTYQNSPLAPPSQSYLDSSLSQTSNQFSPQSLKPVHTSFRDSSSNEPKKHDSHPGLSVDSKHNGFQPESSKLANHPQQQQHQNGGGGGYLDKHQQNLQNNHTKSNKLTNGSSKTTTKSDSSSSSSFSPQNGHLNSKNLLAASSKLKLSSKFSKLNSTEVQTIKNLINSYKESAAFLSRSAEELEQLIGETCQ